MIAQYLDVLKALADLHRLKLFWLLIHVDKKITVAEAMDVTGQTQYNTSRNLKMLFRSGLLLQEKRGKWVYYTLADHQQDYWVSLIESVRQLPETDFFEIKSRCHIRLKMRIDGECVVGANSKQWLGELKGE